MIIMLIADKSFCNQMARNKLKNKNKSKFILGHKLYVTHRKMISNYKIYTRVCVIHNFVRKSFIIKSMN